MNSRVFITGGAGMLASEIELYYRAKGCMVLAPSHQEFDVLDLESLKNTLDTFKPDYVFHTAALHVDDSENNPELAFRLNAWATQNLARVCNRLNSALVYISSCGYFGDEKKYYSEYDPVVLKTVYARSKYKGESLALAECRKTYAIRPGWLFGGSIRHKKNFVYQRYFEAVKSGKIKAANDKYGSPTYTLDLIERMYQILELDCPGVYHLSNSGGCSRAEYVSKIIVSCGLATEIMPVDSSHFLRKALVPDCEQLSNLNAKFLGLSLMPPWEEAIERYAKRMLKEIGEA